MTVERSRFLAGSVALLAGGAARRAQAQAPLLGLRVGATANDTYAQAYYALDLGFFEKAGLNVDLQTFNNGAAVSAAVAGGVLDVGISTPVQLANALEHGIPFVLIAAGALETPKVPAGLMCVAKTGPLRNAKDLEGTVVAVTALKTLSEAALDLWLAKNGADVTKIRVVELTFAEMGPALERGTVAAALITEPALSNALKLGSVRSLGDPFLAVSPQFLLSGWFSTTSFVQKNPDVVKRFQIAIADAGRWANDHHNESAVILAKYAKLEVSAIREMGRGVFTTALRASDIQPELDVAAKFGVIPKPMSAADLLVH